MEWHHEFRIWSRCWEKKKHTHTNIEWQDWLKWCAATRVYRQMCVSNNVQWMLLQFIIGSIECHQTVKFPNRLSFCCAKCASIAKIGRISFPPIRNANSVFVDCLNFDSIKVTVLMAFVSKHCIQLNVKHFNHIHISIGIAYFKLTIIKCTSLRKHIDHVHCK